jgi:KUP system potassium uptake protein
MLDQTVEASEPAPSHRLPVLSSPALGVAVGDIGTSPLYSLTTVLDVTTDNRAEEILGALSPIVWTLILTTFMNYVILAMRVDNDGEAGIFVLMGLLCAGRVRKALGVFIGWCGAGGLEA